MEARSRRRPAPVAPPMPVAPPEPRAVPTGLRISSSGEDFIEWIWNAVEGADGYDVQFSPNEAFTSEDEVIARTGEELSYRREDLAAGTSAYLRVRSASGSGDDRITSDWSVHVVGMTAEPPPPPPAVPTGLRISSIGKDFIEWIWNAVEGADGYDVQFSVNEVFADEAEIITRTAQELVYRREELAAETSAYVRVRSASGSGDDRITSDWSAHVTGMTAEPPPPPPQVTVSFFPEAVALFEGESAEIAVRYQVRELSAPWKLGLSVLGDTAGENDFEPERRRRGDPGGRGHKRRAADRPDRPNGCGLRRGERTGFDPLRSRSGPERRARRGTPGFDPRQRSLSLPGCPDCGRTPSRNRKLLHAVAEAQTDDRACCCCRRDGDHPGGAVRPLVARPVGSSGRLCGLANGDPRRRRCGTISTSSGRRRSGFGPISRAWSSPSPVVRVSGSRWRGAARLAAS